MIVRLPLWRGEELRPFQIVGIEQRAIEGVGECTELRRGERQL